MQGAACEPAGDSPAGSGERTRQVSAVAVAGGQPPVGVLAVVGNGAAQLDGQAGGLGDDRSVGAALAEAAECGLGDGGGEGEPVGLGQLTLYACLQLVQDADDALLEVGGGVDLAHRRLAFSRLT